MDGLVKLRVVTAFGLHRVGDVIERVPGLARDMLAARWYGRRLVEEVKDDAFVSVESTAAPPPPTGLTVSPELLDSPLPALPEVTLPKRRGRPPRTQRKEDQP